MGRIRIPAPWLIQDLIDWAAGEDSSPPEQRRTASDIREEHRSETSALEAKRAAKRRRRRKKNPVRSRQSMGADIPAGPVDWTEGYVLPPPTGPASAVDGHPASGGGRNPLGGLNPQIGGLVPLGLANRGARPMTRAEMDQLVASLVGGQYSSQTSILEQERSRMEGQNEHNLQQIRSWYDQVLGAQGVAAGRSEEFGREAVDASADATSRIVSSLGGEANEGSYVVGAAGAENVGNLQAIATIENQYNADLAPILQAEAAGSLAREQALGSARSRELAMRLAEMQTERSSAEADLRFKLWQANNQILDQRLARQLEIRQMNAGTQQQRYNNKLGLMQAKMAYDAARQQGLLDASDQSFEQWYKSQGLALDAATLNQRGALTQQTNATRLAVEQGKEAGRNFRAQLSAKGKTSSNQVLKLVTSSSGSDTFYSLLANAIEGKDLTPEQAQAVVIGIARAAGLPVKNRAVQALLVEALTDTSYIE